jgi:hypothetical protein
MSAIAEIIDRIRKYPSLDYTADENSISIQPADAQGFPVELLQHSWGYAVYFGEWHEEFKSSDMDEALDCFMLGLSESCRLKVDARGGFPYRWTLEAKHDDRWVAGSEMGLFFFPFWRRRTSMYLQNSFITN